MNEKVKKVLGGSAAVLAAALFTAVVVDSPKTTTPETTEIIEEQINVDSETEEIQDDAEDGVTEAIPAESDYIMYSLNYTQSEAENALTETTDNVNTETDDSNESEGIDMYGTYQIYSIDDFKTEVHITVPDTFTADIVELYLNDNEVDKALLPDGKMVTHPIVTSDLSRIYVLFYVRGETVGVGTFSDNGTLIIKSKEAAVNE